MKKKKIVFVSAIAFFMMTACGGSSEDKIVGQWYEFGTTETIEFFADGTITLAGGRKNAVGNYSLLNEKSMRIDLGRPIVVGYEIDGNILLLSGGAEGNVDRYSRSQEEAMRSLNAIRDQVEEGLAATAGPKSAVAEYILKEKKFGGPSSNEQAGIGDPTDFKTDTIESIAIGRRGDIVVTFNGPSVGPPITGKTLTLSPSRMTGDSVEFRCTTKGINKMYVPEGCAAH